MPSLQRPTLGEITSRPSRFLIAAVMAAIFAMGQANAADTLDTACKTTAECQAQVAKRALPKKSAAAYTARFTP